MALSSSSGRKTPDPLDDQLGHRQNGRGGRRSGVGIRRLSVFNEHAAVTALTLDVRQLQRAVAAQQRVA